MQRYNYSSLHLELEFFFINTCTVLPLVSNSFRACNDISLFIPKVLLFCCGQESSLMMCVSLKLRDLFLAVFSAYEKLCDNMRCPSFDTFDIHFCKMIDNTKLGEITNQFEGQQVNYFLC